MKKVNKIHFALWSIKMFFLEQYYFVKYKREFGKAKKFQNIYSGKRCFVLGNGPSLTIDDLNRLLEKGEITFSSNRIYKFFEETKWRPTYYSVCDRDLFLDNFDAINKQDEFIKFVPSDFAPYLAKFTDYYYYKRYPFKLLSKYPKFCSDFSKVFGEGNTVTYHLLQLAVCMGFKEIYLLGCDFSYNIAIDENGRIIENKEQKNYPWKDDSKPYVLPNLQANLYAYMSAKKYGDSNNIKIYNATRGGKLEVFPRVNLDEILG